MWDSFIPTLEGCSYIADFLCHFLTSPFRFSAQTLPLFAQSTTEHAPERSDPLTEHYISTQICSRAALHF